MALTSATYARISDYLATLYDTALYQRHNLRHPALLYEPTATQIDDVDSAIGSLPTQPVTEDDFAFYNHAYLNTLQNSGRQLFNGTTFVLKQIRTKPLKLEAAYGRYFDMIATCAALEHELLAAADEKLLRLPMRQQYHRAVEPQRALLFGEGRSAAYGGLALVVFNDAGTYKGIVARRSARQAIHPNAYHLLPAFMFQPRARPAQPHEWSLSYHVYREFLEELFGMPEDGSADWQQHPAYLDWQQMVAAGQASLHLVGVAMNLLNLRAEYCTLMLIRDPQWWVRVTAPHSPLRLNTAAETDGGLLAVPIATDDALLTALGTGYHLRMPPHALVGLWAGTDLARRLLTS